MKKLFLLDAYALIYRAYYGFINSPRMNSKGENTSAVFGFVNTLEDVLRTERPDYLGVAFDPKGGTFRHKIYPEYKAQRQETPEGIRFAIPFIKDILSAYNIPILEVENYEADDVIGTLAWRFSSDEMGVFMMTPDKDYGQLVRKNVWMFRPVNGAKRFEVWGEKEVCEKYGIQKTIQVIDLLALMGDASDNIPGCAGVGEKTAVKLINEFGSVENLLEHQDQLKGALKKKVEEGEENIKFSKFLATINTEVPINVTVDELLRKDIDREKLSELFDRLEFNALKKRIVGGEKEKFAVNGIGGSGTEVENGDAAAAQKKGKKGKTAQQDSGMLDLFGMNNASTQNSATSQKNEINGEKNGAENANFCELFAGDGSENEKNEILRGGKIAEQERYLTENEQEISEICRKILYGKSVHLEILARFSVENDPETLCIALLYPTLTAEEENAEPGEKNLALAMVPKEKIGLLRPILENEEVAKVGHNLKFLIERLADEGIELGGPLFDTMIAHYVLHPELRHELEYQAQVNLNIELRPLKDLGKLAEAGLTTNEKTLGQLLALRLLTIKTLRETLENALKSDKQWRLFSEMEMPLVPVLARMERNGVVIDTASLAQTSAEFTKKMGEIEAEIFAMAGHSFNISSPKQVGEVLFTEMKIVDKPKKTKTGQFVTSEDVLQNLRSKHEIVGKILEYRGYKKLLSTYIDALPQLINKKTGHIHTSFNQAVTATGRLSSSNPNLQNIPVRDANGKEVRKAFVAEPGCEFFSADYSQIELRIMAHMSGDQHLISAFLSGHDIHRATAAKIYHIPIEEVTPEQRRKAKTANFGIIYGITTFGLAERMEVPRSEAKELIDEYFATYHDVKNYMDESIAKARENGYTETLFHRRCYLPDINSHNATVRGYAERNAINAPIQGTAADIVKLAMIRIDKRMREENLRSKMILQVHDELNFSVLPEEKAQMEKLVKEEMEGVCAMSVPLIVDCGWGKNWLEAH